MTVLWCSCFVGWTATGSAVAATARGPGLALIYLVAPTTFEDFMKAPAFRQLARAGGAGLMATDENYRSNPRDAYEALGSGTPPSASTIGLLARTLRADGASACYGRPSLGGEPAPTGQISVARALGLASERACKPGARQLFVVDLTTLPVTVAARLIGQAPMVGRRPTLEIVTAAYPSAAMNRAGDEVTPIALAAARPPSFHAANGLFHSLTSATTRQAGLVANVDVAPTVLSFYGIDPPAAMDGAPITVTGNAAPFALHRKHLEQRRIRLPIQLFELALVCGLGAVGIVALVALGRGRRLPRTLAAAIRFLTLSMVALMIPIALAGWLPTLTYEVVFPYLIGSSLLLAWLSLAWPFDRGRLRRQHPLAPFGFLGAIGGLALVLDLALGSHGLRMPLLGGTMFDGVRFYGLPNAFEDALLASAIFVAFFAFRGNPFRGAVLLFLCGLAAGFPRMGADLGGSLTLFFAAGLWWQLRKHGRLRLVELIKAAAVAAAGLIVVLLANRYLPGAPTHVTHFVQQSGGRASKAFDEIGYRLSVGARQVARDPAALIPLIGLPVVLWVTLIAPTPIREALAVEPGWRDVIVVLVLASVVAFFVNDTGVAAAAPSFLYAMAALVYPALLPSVPIRSEEPEDVGAAA